MAEPMSNTMRKSVTFSSQPQLEEGTSVQRLPAIDLLHLRLTHQQAEADARRGIFDRIIGMFIHLQPCMPFCVMKICILIIN